LALAVSVVGILALMAPVYVPEGVAANVPMVATVPENVPLTSESCAMNTFPDVKVPVVENGMDSVRLDPVQTVLTDKLFVAIV
jgi:hypothetical protein